jgi:predicted DNA-binding WGR domain protein
MTTLTRVDPDRHMDRWYSVTVQPTLLDPVAVVCAWGSRRSRYQRLRVLPAPSAAAAQAQADRIVRAKQRRGYRADLPH